MGIHTQASLQRLFEASRLRSLKRKQQEQLKYKKAQESIKKALAKQQSKEQEKTSQNNWKQQTEPISRTICIYNTRYVERFADENELYQTREQLKEAEQRGEGKINWTLWQELVNKTRQELNTR